MAKSLRSKVKRDFRSKKRETGIYAATEAARLNRLNAKLVAVASQKRKGGDEDDETADGEPASMTADDLLKAAGPTTEAAMDVDESQLKKISTHGTKNSRREEWRLSKGLSPRPTSKGMNRQGGIAAARKSGRSKRRR